MPLQATSGAASYDAFGGGAAAVPTFIEDVFSTYLYTGTGVAQTITNGIDVSTKGGLVWIKARNVAGEPHVLVDSARGATRALRTSGTDAEVNDANRVSAFTTSGFSIGTDGELNGTGNTHASWTFRKQPKYFDVVTWTGSGANRTIAHNLGSVPGSIIVKRTDTTANWAVYHRSLANTQYLVLNLTNAPATGATWWNSTTPTSSVFSVGTDASVNASGGTYVAYIFAHNAGGFGELGTDNVISCGSFTSDGSGGCDVNLGYEPQWVLYKNITTTEVWRMADVMRGWNQTQLRILNANSTAAEGNVDNNPSYLSPTSTGFNTPTPGYFTPSQTFAYIAIRRGPMKVPTVGTEVFEPATRTGTGAAATITSSTYPVDMTWIRQTNGSSGYSFMFFDRVRGPLKLFYTNNDQSQNNTSYTVTGFDVQNGYYLGDDASGYGTNVSGQPIVYYNFKRAPSFFDEVFYTGTGSATTFSHNLSAVPELILVKSRSRNPSAWAVYANNDNTDYLVLNTSAATADDNTYWNDTSPTSSVFSVGTDNNVNASASTYVAYLFATCAGVSKVGSYTGNGSTQTINCGFGAGGARFVLIKRTDSTGDWYVYDTARGMTVLTDPYLLLNSANAQVATLGSVTTVSTGFALNSTILAAINVSAGTYIFLAIA
jgi:hypothetical protein